MSSLTSAATTFLISSTESLSTSSKNLANSDTAGSFADLTVFKETSTGGQLTGVETRKILNTNAQLQTKGTAYEGDLTIMGEGMLIVTTQDQSDNNLYVKTGSFNHNERGDLEDNGKYLKGYAYDDTGNLGSELVQINIDKNKVSEAEASTKIDLAFKLNADTVATGESGVMMKDSVFSGVAGYKDSEIVINRAIRSNIHSAPPSSDQELLQFGGFVETNVVLNTYIAATGSTTVANNVLMTFSIQNNSQPPRAIDLKNIVITASTTYVQALQLIADEINKSHGQILGAKILKDDTATKSSLFIYSKDNNNQISFEITAALYAVFGGPSTLDFDNGDVINAVDSTQKRFATMEQLKTMLSKDSFNVSFIGATKDKIFLHSAEDEMLEIKNRDAGSDVLSFLGVFSANQGDMEPVLSLIHISEPTRPY